MEFAEYIPTPKVNGVWCSDGRPRAISGTLCLTGHHMILYADNTSYGEVWILYKNIDSIEKRLGLDKGTLVVKCKDLRVIHLTIPGVEEAGNVAFSAEKLSSIMEPTLHYPYFYRPKFQSDEKGWDLYSIESDLAKVNATTERWRISDVNSMFSVCGSYPSRVIVPFNIDDTSLQRSARFREHGRFPVLSYCHKNGAAIIRSSQPLMGQGNKRSKDDEKLINAMLGPSHRGYVLDLRSTNGASQAKSKGGGYEIEHHYPRWRRMHINLHNYYVQQESLIRVVEASKDKSSSMDKWLSKLESSNWLEYLKRALDASCLVAQCIDREEWSVLVHGSEGFDSTLTVTSLAEIILNPDYRTIRGFLTLIEREWIQAGHPFSERSSHGPYSNSKQRGEGPVFSIFLECVFQLHYQFPLSFEFTTSLLVDLRRHSYASEFGTFLFNNMQERKRGKVESRTVSLWSYIFSPLVFNTYINPLYKKSNDVIWPSVAPQSLEFWDELYIPELATGNGALQKVQSLEVERIELQSLVAKLRTIGNLSDADLKNFKAAFSSLVEDEKNFQSNQEKKEDELGTTEVGFTKGVSHSQFYIPTAEVGSDAPVSTEQSDNIVNELNEFMPQRQETIWYATLENEAGDMYPKVELVEGVLDEKTESPARGIESENLVSEQQVTENADNPAEKPVSESDLIDLLDFVVDPDASPPATSPENGENDTNITAPILIDLGVISLDSNESSSNSPEAVSPTPS